MGSIASIDDAGLLSGWLRVGPARGRAPQRRASAVAGVVRFAFYGRISTGEFQDVVSSRAWQLDSARQVIASRGRIGRRRPRCWLPPGMRAACSMR